MTERWARRLAHWTEAGVVDEATAERIRAFEQERAGAVRLNVPIILALAFGALTIAAGVLLFVSAHWDAMSPSARFALVLGLVAAFHVVGALTAERFGALSITLHAVGTGALGAGIYLAGQIFHLEEHWPSGMLLWALGAVIAWALLGQGPQMALAAVLVPSWLISEWVKATDQVFLFEHTRVISSGVFLLSLTYFTAVRAEQRGPWRRVLMWIGGVALLPASAALALEGETMGVAAGADTGLPPGLRVLGWAVAFGLPLLLGLALHRRAAWPIAVAGAWVALLLHLDAWVGVLALYGAWALFSVGLAVWGLRAGRSERVNMGAALFACTLLTFYSSEVMDKLGRSASLLGLGLLFVGGGWLLERARRRLVSGMRGGTP